MPKYPTFPYLFDENKSISTKDLKKLGYLVMDTQKKGDIIWSRNGVATSSIGIETIMRENGSCEIRLIYSCNNISHNYSIALECLPSNLGNGKIWYFNCPFTGLRCRKLHLIDGKFMHRSAVPGGMYSIQTTRKSLRQYASCFDSEKHYKEIFSKNFKKSYNGKPTRRYKKLLREIEKSKKYNAKDLEQLFLM